MNTRCQPVPDPIFGTTTSVPLLDQCCTQLSTHWRIFPFLLSVWQLLLAHFGGLIWPTLGRCRLGKAFALPSRKNKDRRRSCGNVGIPPLLRDFQGRWKEWETGSGVFHAFHGPSFPQLTSFAFLRFHRPIPLFGCPPKPIRFRAGLQNVGAIRDAVQQGLTKPGIRNHLRPLRKR